VAVPVGCEFSSLLKQSEAAHEKSSENIPFGAFSDSLNQSRIVCHYVHDEYIVTVAGHLHLLPHHRAFCVPKTQWWSIDE
jgi:hypothetical protein